MTSLGQCFFHFEEEWGENEENGDVFFFPLWIVSDLSAIYPSDKYVLKYDSMNDNAKLFCQTFYMDIHI